MRWWRRNEGFEWKDYVRTTVLVRRQQRRDKLEAAKAAAVEGVKEAGRKGLAAGAAGAEVAGQAAVKLAKSAAEGAADGAEKGLALVVRAAAAARTRIASASAPVNARLAAPAISRTMAVVCLLSGAGASVRIWQFGLDADVLLLAAVSGLNGVLWLWPRVFAASSEAEDEWALRTERAVAVVDRAGSMLPLGAAGLFALVMMWFAAPTLRGWLHEGGRDQAKPGAVIADASTLEGFARVAGPGQLRIGGTMVRLEGITPLEANQTCRRADQTSWACGAAAKAAFEKIVRGRRDVRCTLSGETDGGRAGTCRIDGRDLAAELVRFGHAFADGLVWKTYAAEEDQAQAARAGLWAGEAERPDAWRTRLFTDAAEKAPGGCPIKGRLQSGKRIYVLPHQTDYGGPTIREARGERWFCSRDEAEAAGFAAAK